jgi:hypothetical protein
MSVGCVGGYYCDSSLVCYPTKQHGLACTYDFECYDDQCEFDGMQYTCN